MTLKKLLAFCLIVSIYYLVGGDGFPDYQNYITLSEGGGYLFLPDEYFFEWFSRFWLAHVGAEIGDHQLSVDMFVVLIQAIYFVWLMCDSGDPKYEVAKFWITVFLGPLLITTTLRGSPAYLAVFWMVAANRSSWALAMAALAALAFHDSAILPIVVLVLSRLFGRLDARPVRAALLVLGAVLIIIGTAFLQIAVPLLLQLGLGIRAVYLLDALAPSLPKIVYALFVGALCIPLCWRRSAQVEQGFFVLALFTASAMLFALSSTAAIRMLLYVFGAALILIMKHDNGMLPRFARMTAVQAILAPPLIALMFWDLFRHATV